MLFVARSVYRFEPSGTHYVVLRVLPVTVRTKERANIFVSETKRNDSDIVPSLRKLDAISVSSDPGFVHIRCTVAAIRSG